MSLSFKDVKKSCITYFEKDFFAEIIASLSYAVGIAMFSAPNNIIGGGVTGIAIILNFIMDVPIGFLSFLLNVPLVIIGFKYIGHVFMIKTFRLIVITSAAIDILEPFLPKYTGNDIMASLFAGVFIGLALAIIMTRGGSTGGTDIIVKLMKKKKPHMQLGTIVFITDIIVILGGAFVFRDIEVILLGIICTYAQSEVINRFVKGQDERYMLLSVTRHYREVADAIMNDTSRGATIIKCEGAYSGENLGIVLSVMESAQTIKAKKAIREVDPDAFNLISGVAETLGEGFKELKGEED